MQRHCGNNIWERQCSVRHAKTNPFSFRKIKIKKEKKPSLTHTQTLTQRDRQRITFACMPFVAIIYRLSAKIFQLSHKDSISQAIYTAGHAPLCSRLQSWYKQFIYPQRCGRGLGKTAGPAVQMSNVLGPKALIYMP